jgi:NifU-like protein involved in Fe-S cluster formation
MIYSPEEKRRVILDNYNYPTKQIKLEELKKVSDGWKFPFSTFRSLDQGCGDVIHLLLRKKGDGIESCYFSAQKSCLVTISVTNIICSYLEGMKNKTAQELIDNCWLMLENKEYNLNDYPKLQVFNDISRFPNRLECVRLVIRAVTKTLK